MNPWDLRMKNLMPVDAPDQDSPFRVWSGKGVNECLDQGLQGRAAMPPSGMRREPRPFPTAGCTASPSSATTTATAASTAPAATATSGWAARTTPASASCTAAGSKASEGPQTEMSIVVAEVLGLNWSDIYFAEWGNSDVNFDTGNQVGSGHTGAATSYYNTAMEMRNRLFARAITLAPFKDIAGITAADLDAKNSEIFYTKDPTKKTTHNAVVNAAGSPR